MKKNVHIISHSHWDREWYMPFEYHRARLVKLIDDCMELFEKDEEFMCFHLDGHTALIEDYLEIKPQNREKIKKYVEEGRFSIGPWYVLQDEFLTSAEANIRNLLVGIRIAKDFGKVTLLGYFPDTFGNVGQMPQILKQAGIKAAAFGRGVKPTGMNNTVSEGDDYQSQYSELYWQSPDGSRIPSILFANWYNNGSEIPVNGDSKYWETALRNVEKYASTKELLLMNGCDHQPVQRDLTQALHEARRKYPDYQFIHSSFEKYMDDLIRSMPEDLVTIQGELTGQDTDGWFNLINTASSHMDLKIMNKECENLLENAAEPLAVIAAQMGKECPRDMLLYAWKALMKNHPHDSICGCSCDEVNDEVRMRFIKSRQAAETIVQDSLDYAAQHMDISGLEDCDAVFAIVNTFAQTRSGVVSADVDIRRIYERTHINAVYDKINDSLYEGEYEVIDQSGNSYACTVSNQGARFGYDLPEDGFRQTYVAETVNISFEACDVPAMGYRVYGLKKSKQKEPSESLVADKNTMENPYLKVSVQTDGTLTVQDKENGRIFSGLMRFEDMADLGSEYTFIPAPSDIPVLSGDADAKIELICDEPFKAEYKITVEMQLPESADSLASVERDTYVGLKDRKAGRSKQRVPFQIISYVSLEKGSRCVKITTEFENTVKDHRLRVLFPTDISCTQHKAESIFEAVKRDNRHKSTWIYPSGCDRQQGFVTMEDEISGLGIGNTGLYEYEILEDNIIAVTLVRSVGEMGDWGVFPTELSQVQKRLSLSYEIVPFKKERDAWMEFAAFQNPLHKVQIRKSCDKQYLNQQFVWNGDGLRPFAFKTAQESADIIMRWVNYSEHEQLLTVKKTEWIDNLHESNVLEERGELLKCQDGEWRISVKPFEIITVCCKKA